jgi:cytoskeletal protein CcmA (bactofilin family)
MLKPFKEFAARLLGMQLMTDERLTAQMGAASGSDLETISSIGAPKVDPAVRDSVKSLIAEGVSFEGNLTVNGGMKIDGEVKGSVVSAEGTIILTGRIHGNLSAETAFVDGEIEGDVSVMRILLGPKARIRGSVSYGEMHWRQGARIDGTVCAETASDVVRNLSGGSTTVSHRAPTVKRRKTRSVVAAHA